MKNSEHPAFPDGYTEPGSEGSGLTKREYFAAMAMQGLIFTYNNMYVESDQSKPDAAKKAVQFADALLAELEKNADPGL